MSAPRPLRAQGIVEMLRLRYEAGDKQVLLAAVNWCLVDRKPAPEWVQAAYGAALRRFQDGDAATFDEALGIERQSKGVHTAAAQQRRFLGLRVAFSIYQIHCDGKRPLKLAKRDAARAYGIGATRADEYWTEHRRVIEEWKAEPDARMALTLEALIGRLMETEPDLHKRVEAIARYHKRKPRAS